MFRPVCTMLSAISEHGIRPEKDAEVYPYVTLAINLRANCRLLRVLLTCSWVRFLFILSLIMTRVSKISESILASKDTLTRLFTYRTLFGATYLLICDSHLTYEMCHLTGCTSQARQEYCFSGIQYHKSGQPQVSLCRWSNFD